MNPNTNIHPDLVLEAIQSTSRHPVKKRNLALFHEVCMERHELGSKDFSLKSIGEATECRGGLKAKALWNAQSADYRKLIDAWQAYVGPPAPKLKEATRAAGSFEFMQNIADPATRIIVEKLLRERDSLRAELNIMKAATTLTIDRRPSSMSPPPVSTSANCTVEANLHLNQLENEALEHAISRELWEQEGWFEEKLGRVVAPVQGSNRVRTIFKPGFVPAVKKLLRS
jgi:hypothetical protein